MKIFKLSLVLFAVIVAFGVYSYAHCGSCGVKAEKAEKAVKAGHHIEKGTQTVCPVMGNKISKDSYVDYNGKRVYFCCDACHEKFKAEPDKYLKKLADSGVVLVDAPIKQSVCPISGKEIDKNVFSDYNGKRIYFGGQMCKSAFDKDPEKYIDKVKWDKEDSKKKDSSK